MILNKILSRRFAVVLMMLFVQFCDVAYADNINQGDCDKVISEVAPYVFSENEESISRYDALVSLMKIIGVDKNSAYEYSHSLLEESFKDFNPCENVKNGYSEIAKMYDIAYGVKSTRYFGEEFEGEKVITVKEMLAFMLRCIKTEFEPKWENIFEIAYEYGLINEEEMNNAKDTADLSQQYAHTLYTRFLNTNVYKYYQTGEPISGYTKTMLCNVDAQLTYLQFYLSLDKDDTLKTHCGNCHSSIIY